jgi:hypothetical protein
MEKARVRQDVLQYYYFGQGNGAYIPGELQIPLCVPKIITFSQFSLIFV